MSTTTIETILVTTATGKTTVFDLVQDLCPNTWTRAYARGTGLYYDLETFEAGLLSPKVQDCKRISLFDLPYEADVDAQGCLK